VSKNKTKHKKYFYNSNTNSTNKMKTSATQIKRKTY